MRHRSIFAMFITLNEITTWFSINFFQYSSHYEVYYIKFVTFN